MAIEAATTAAARVVVNVRAMGHSIGSGGYWAAPEVLFVSVRRWAHYAGVAALALFRP
jgi:hypothetical protein